MTNWFVIQVLSTHEKKVKKRLDEGRVQSGLTEQVHEILLPTENISEVKGGQTRVLEKRLWPGYLLVKMDLNDETWSWVKGTNGVIGFLGGVKPTALTDHEVKEILEDLKEKKEVVTQRHQFEVGSNVKITEGVFVNFIGLVQEVFPEKGQLSVLVSIFGRDTRVDELNFHQVEEITDDVT